MNDTSPEIARMVRERMMGLSGERRFLMGVAMFDAARRMILASLPAELSEAERRRQLYWRTYGEKLPDEVANWVKPA